MILTRCLLTLLGIIALQSEGNGNLLEGNDEQTCMDVCHGCGGTANFEDNVCQCHVARSDQQGAEYITRITRQAQKLGLDVVSCNFADADADRPARCILSPFRRFKDRGDGDLIAKYFTGNGLAGFGSLLGSPKPQTEEVKTGTEDVALTSTAQNTGSSAAPGSNGDESTSDSVVRASNPFGSAHSMSDQFVAMNPLLGAAAAWLQPQTLLAMRSGMQTVGSSGPNNDNNKMDSMSANMVGLPHQNTAGDSQSMKTLDPLAYPAGTIVGMTPYSYVVGAPNPIQIQDGSDVPPMQPYLYSYDSMIGTQNPSLIGGNHAGLPPHWNCLASPGGPNNSDFADSAVGVERDPDETAQAAEDMIGQANSDPSLDLKKDTDFHSKTELKTMQNEDDKGVVGSKQTAVNREEGKDLAVGSSSYSTKRRQSKSKSNKSDTKSETMVEH